MCVCVCVCVCVYFSPLFVEVPTVYIYSSPKFDEHIYSHYFELFVGYVAYLCFV